MICTTIQNKSLGEIFNLLDGDPSIEMAEIRLDRCPKLSEEDIETLFSQTDIPLVATCRVNESRDFFQAEKRLTVAIEAGARYVDLEIEAPSPMGKRIRRACDENSTILIRSEHDFDGTPSEEELKSTIDKCRHFGAEVVKVVTTAHSNEDVDRVMSLYGYTDPATLIAFCMGETGRDSRVECLRQGAPFSYAALTETEAAAPGQWPAKQMRKAVYGDFPFIPRHPLTKPLAMPSSKSFAQRAIIAAALASGVSHLSGYSPCSDNEAAIAVARALGADVTVGTSHGAGRSSTLVIKGTGARIGSAGIAELHTGESGLLTRLMIPVLAAINRNDVRVSGEKTLTSRPLTGAGNIMASFGVTLESDRTSDVYVPLTVHGPLIPGRADISGKDGSQLISGLLMALPFTDKNSTIFVHDPKSIPYMFITMDVLQKFGIEIVNEMKGGDEFLETNDWSLCTEMTFRIRGGQRYHAADFSIEADWSSAADFLVAGAVFGSTDIQGLDTKSLQADLSIMDILMEAGAGISESAERDNDSLHVQRAPLRAFDVDANNCPDLFPIIAVLAAFCPGTSHVLGVGRLSHKESDRAKAILDMLTQMGVEAEIDGDEMMVEGRSLTERILTGSLLHGGKYSSCHDHRMVMALKVAGLGADSPIEIDDTGCVSKSFPGFLDIFTAAVN